MFVARVRDLHGKAYTRSESDVRPPYHDGLVVSVGDGAFDDACFLYCREFLEEFGLVGGRSRCVLIGGGYVVEGGDGGFFGRVCDFDGLLGGVGEFVVGAEVGLSFLSSLEHVKEGGYR